MVSLSDDQFYTIVCLLLAYPLAFLHKAMPDIPSLKHSYSLAVGVVFSMLCFDPFAWIHGFISGLIVYFIVWKFEHKFACKAVYGFALCYISVAHLYRMWIDFLGWHLDFTGPQMVITIKLIQFAYNISDGVECKKGHTDKMYPYWKEKALFSMPSLLEFFGWLFFFPGYLVGPAFEMKEYLEFTDPKVFGKGASLPCSFKPAALKFLQAMVVVPFLLLSIQNPISLVLTEEFASHSLWKKHLYSSLLFGLIRSKYYFGWLMAEGAMIAIGLGYNRKTTRWDLCCNVKPLQVELAQNAHAWTSGWNCKTNDFLKHYCYLRLTPIGTKPRRRVTFITYLLSAVWHGFYFSYFCCFLCGAGFDLVARVMRSRVRPLFLKTRVVKASYDCLTWATSALVVGYLGTIFSVSLFRLRLLSTLQLLSRQSCMQFLRMMHYDCVFPVVIILSLHYSLLLCPRKQSKEPKRENSA